MSQDPKMNNYIWACGVVREAVDSGLYGTLTLSVQNGVIGNVKTETNSKPPIDNTHQRS